MSADEGFYLMYRGWLDNSVFSGEPFSRRDAWCWIIESAAFEPHTIGVKGKSISISRGQLCHSLRHMAKEWGWEVTRVLRFMQRLQREDMIRYSTETGQAIISVCKYDDYQCDVRSTATPTATAPQQHRNSDATIYKEGKEGKEEGIIPTTSGPEPDPPPPVDLLGQPIAVSLGAVVFSAGLKVLLAGGVRDRQARALLGKWRKEVGDAQLIELLETAERAAISEPVAWITKAISTRQAAASEEAGYGAAEARRLYADLGVML